MLASTTLLSLASSGSLVMAAPTSKVTRVDDILVLEDSLLVFDPVGGLNATTSDPGWQARYLKTIMNSKVSHSQQKARDVLHLVKRQETECVRKMDCPA